MNPAGLLLILAGVSLFNYTGCLVRWKEPGQRQLGYFHLGCAFCLGVIALIFAFIA